MSTATTLINSADRIFVAGHCGIHANTTICADFLLANLNFQTNVIKKAWPLTM
jgi:hypothetical protein